MIVGDLLRPWLRRIQTAAPREFRAGRKAPAMGRRRAANCRPHRDEKARALPSKEDCFGARQTTICRASRPSRFPFARAGMTKKQPTASAASKNPIDRYIPLP